MDSALQEEEEILEGHLPNAICLHKREVIIHRDGETIEIDYNENEPVYISADENKVWSVLRLGVQEKEIIDFVLVLEHFQPMFLMDNMEPSYYAEACKISMGQGREFVYVHPEKNIPTKTKMKKVISNEQVEMENGDLIDPDILAVLMTWEEKAGR